MMGSSCNAFSSSTTQPPARSGKALNRDLLMSSISKFYMTPGIIQRILPVVKGTSKISLRMVDWFVTNYAKRHNVILLFNVSDYIISKHSHDRQTEDAKIYFNVFTSYRDQLRAYTKQQFDPFRRRDRIAFYYERDSYLETTIGQLNFFRWMLQNKLLDYIDEHFELIEREMLMRSLQHRRGRRAEDLDAATTHKGQDEEAEGEDADNNTLKNTTNIYSNLNNTLNNTLNNNTTCVASQRVVCGTSSAAREITTHKKVVSPPRMILFD